MHGFRGTVALVLFGAALSGCSRPAEESIRKGHVYLKMGQLDDAEREFTRAVEHDPKSVFALEGVANVSFERGQLDRAAEYYQRAIDADPKAITPRHQLALTLATRGELARAVTVLEQAVEVAPKNPYALSMIGGLKKKLGDLAAAERYQLLALEADEKYHAARYALANLMLDSGRLEDAERQLSVLAKRGATQLADYGFARLAARAGRHAEAAGHLDRLLAAGVSEPARILEDEAFRASWSDPAMAALRTKLSTAATSTHTPP